LLDEAIEQALRAGHLDVAANLVQNLSEEQLLAEQNVGMLLRWKMDLPDSLLISTPRLIVLYAWALGLACQLDAAEELGNHLSRFLPAPSATAQKSMLAQWLALSGIIARGRGDSDTARRYCSEALTSLPQKRYGQRLLCLSTLANLAIAEGDLWRARALESRRTGAGATGRQSRCSKRWRTTTALVPCKRGVKRCARWNKCDRGLSRLTALSSQRLYAVRARLTLYEGYLLVQCLQPDAGRARLVAGLAEARACRDISVLIGHCVIAGSKAGKGEFAEGVCRTRRSRAADAHLGRAPGLLPGDDHPGQMRTVAGSGAHRSGRSLAAATGPDLWRRSSGCAPEFHPQLPLHVELQQALLEVIQGQPMLAEGRLSGLLEHGQQTGRQLLSAMALTQKVSLLLGCGREPEARKALSQALDAAAGGVLQPFEGLLAEHPDWLRGQLQLNPPTPVSQSLMEKLPALLTRPDVESGAAEQLSTRELAVLRLIAQGCSNQEISDQLFISLHTVKTHASHINSKLGVERRTQAVARAKALGVLS
jgi:LuxR family maltose regulon positive regulatory protein